MPTKKLTIPFDVNTILNALPTGSGIDNGWAITKYTPYTYRFDSSFHNMDDMGYYTHWTDFAVILKVVKKLEIKTLNNPAKTQILARPGDIEIIILCRNRNLKEYLCDLIYDYLQEFITIRNEVVDTETLKREKNDI